MEQSFTLFCDSDGVLADFEKHFKDTYKKDFDNTPPGLAWSLIGKYEKFFANLPFMPEAQKFWDGIKKYNPVILTGANAAKFAQAEVAKREFYAKHENVFGPVEVIVCLSKDKQKHMRKPGDILIDDTQKNIDRWVEAGGIGILYKNADQALADLETVIANLKEEQEEKDAN